MLDFVKHNPIEAITFAGLCIAAVLFALHRLDWLRVKPLKWDGIERRTCPDHPVIHQRVCTLHENLSDIELKLDSVAEKVQYILGMLETRWGKLRERNGRDG